MNAYTLHPCWLLYQNHGLILSFKKDLQDIQLEEQTKPNIKQRDIKCDSGGVEWMLVCAVWDGDLSYLILL